MRVLIIISLAILSSLSGYSNNRRDSLWNIWLDPAIHDSIRTNAFYFSVFHSELAPANVDERIELGHEILKTAEKYNDNKMLSQAYGLLGSFSSGLVSIDSTYSLRQKALEYARKGNYPRGIALNLRQMSKIDMNLGRLDSVESRLFKSREICVENNFIQVLYIVLERIGTYYAYYDVKLALSIQYANEAFKMAQSQKDYERCSQYCSVIASLSANAKDYDFSNKYYVKAEKYAEKAGVFNLLFNIALGRASNSLASKNYDEGYKIMRSIYKRELYKNDYSKAYTDGTYATFLIKRNEIDSAIAIYNSVLSFFEKNERVLFLSLANAELSNCYALKGNYEKGLEYAKKGLKLSYSAGLDRRARAYNVLSKNYKGLGNFKRALYFKERSIEATDSIETTGAISGIIESEMLRKFETDSLNNIKTQLEQELIFEKELGVEKRNKNIFFGSAILLVLVAGGITTRLRYIRRSKNIIEKEKARSDDLLLNILPAQVAEELKETGQAKAQKIEQASVLFTDFKHFTQMAEGLDAESLVEEINIYFKAFDAICKKHNVEKIKTIGDAYMAAAGLTSKSIVNSIHTTEEDQKSMEHGLSTKSLVLAAIDMQDFIITRNAKPETAKLEMRAGIHTGPVVAGIVGDTKFQYDIWGDTVNTASRMESHGEVGKVNISGATYEILKEDDWFDFEVRNEIEVKGKGNMKMYFVNPFEGPDDHA
ncbi:MAG: tetratricopeptide repeat protein [Bacteroidia bacterium]